MRQQARPIIPLAQLREMLRLDELPISQYYARVFRNLLALNGNIKAFLRETQRQERINARLEELRRLWPDPHNRPPLYGVPFGVKDIYGVDGLPVKAGSRLPSSVIKLPQSPIVSRFLEAGAVVLGKTVSTEFAYFQPALTRNPLNLDHTPGGSSSGSAAAVAAGICPFALGSQTIGSIIRPASYCGVVGFKPSYGRASTEGLFPFSPVMDHPGIICMEINDLDLLAPILLDEWKPEGAALPIRVGIPHPDYMSRAKAPALANFRKCLEALRTQGFEPLETPIFADIDALEEENQALCSRGFHDTHQELWEKYNSYYSTRSTVYFLQGSKVGPKLWKGLLSSLNARRERIADQFAASGIDLLISPSTTETAPKGLSGTGSPAMSLPFTHHGLPSLTFPCGQASNGLPYGLQIAAAPGRDEYLISAAKFMHRAIHPR